MKVLEGKYLKSKISRKDTAIDYQGFLFFSVFKLGLPLGPQCMTL